MVCYQQLEMPPALECSCAVQKHVAQRMFVQAAMSLAHLFEKEAERIKTTLRQFTHTDMCVCTLCVAGMIGPQSSGSWIQRLPKLTSVSADVADEHGLVGLLRHTGITDLSLGCISSASSDAIQVIGSIDCLTKLSLKDGPKILDSAALLLTRLTNLQALSLCRFPHVTDVAMSRILQVRCATNVQLTASMVIFFHQGMCKAALFDSFVSCQQPGA